eukprot:249415-Chlamydomonas_euryale.AAC.4
MCTWSPKTAWLTYRPRSTWWVSSVAALSPVLTSRLAGCGRCGMAQDDAYWRSLCDSTQPAV